MLWNAFSTLVYGAQKVFNFLYTFKVYGNVTLLGVIVGFFVLFMIIDNFVLKGQ